MKKHEAERLITVIRELVTDGAPQEPRRIATAADLTPKAVTGTGNGKVHLDPDTLETLYRAFKNRLIDELRVDPILLQLIAQRPEIILEIEPQVLTLDGGTTRGRVARLIASGWFKTTRATGAARKELARTGPDPGGGGTLSDILSEMVRNGFLSREGDGYLEVPGLKITEKRIEV